ncbi:ankyrin repeat-containing domain protein [Aspergillus crustosus]
MDLALAELPTDPIERRRLQSRIAQRKFRQKRKLEQSKKRARNDQPDRSDSQTPTETPLELNSAIPSTFTMTWDSNDLGVVTSDLEAIDNLLGSYNPSDLPLPLNEPLSFFESSHSGTSASVVAAGSQPAPFQLPNPESEAARNATGHVPENVAHDPLSTENESGWLGTIHIAAQKGHDRILRVLFERGNIDPDSTDSDKRTALFHAAVGGHNDVVRLLLNHGAIVTHLDSDDRSVLHWATHYQKLAVMQTLIEHWPKQELRSSVNAHDSHGWTPVHLAVERGFEEGLLLLLQHGGDMNTKARKCWLSDRVIPFNLSQLVAQAPGGISPSFIPTES